MAPPTPNVQDIHSLAEFFELLKIKKHVALQAHATWCGPCKAISPMFNKHALTHSNKQVTFCRFDTDEVPALAGELGIRSIPAFYFFEDGEKVNSLAGANPPALEKHITELAAKAPPALSTTEDF